MATLEEQLYEMSERLADITYQWMLEGNMIKDPDEPLPHRVMVLTKSDDYPYKPIWEQLVTRHYPQENATTWRWVHLQMLKQQIPIAYNSAVGELQGWYLGDESDVKNSSVTRNKKANTMIINNAFTDEVIAVNWDFEDDDNRLYFAQRHQQIQKDRLYIAEKTGVPYQRTLFELMFLGGGDNPLLSK